MRSRSRGRPEPARPRRRSGPLLRRPSTLPYVPGCEAVGRLDGERVYLFGEGRGTSATASSPSASTSLRELAVPVPEGSTTPSLPPAGSPALPAGCRSPRWRRSGPDDRVLVLGATGTVGSIAVQVARTLGAERVVAAGRDPDRLERARSSAPTRRCPRRRRPRREAARGSRRGRAHARGRRALGRAGPRRRRGRSSAGADRPCRPVRGARGDPRVCGRPRKAALDPRPLELRALARRATRRRTSSVAGHVAAGRIRIDVETFSLDEIGEAWAAQAAARRPSSASRRRGPRRRGPRASRASSS